MNKIVIAKHFRLLSFVLFLCHHSCKQIYFVCIHVKTIYLKIHVKKYILCRYWCKIYFVISHVKELSKFMDIVLALWTCNKLDHTTLQSWVVCSNYYTIVLIEKSASFSTLLKVHFMNSYGEKRKSYWTVVLSTG